MEKEKEEAKGEEKERGGKKRKRKKKQGKEEEEGAGSRFRFRSNRPSRSRGRPTYPQDLKTKTSARHTPPDSLNAGGRVRRHRKTPAINSHDRFPKLSLKGS